MSTDPHADRIFVAGPDGFRVSCGCGHTSAPHATRAEAMTAFRAHLPQPSDHELAGRILAETPLDSLPAHLRPDTSRSTERNEEGASATNADPHEHHGGTRATHPAF